MGVELEPTNDERLEMTREEVRQVEGCGLVLLHRVPGVVSGQEAVAVGAGQAFHAVSIQHDVQRAGRAAIGIGDEDPVVAAGDLGELHVDCVRDLRRRVVELGGKAAHVDVGPPVEADHREHLARDRSARQDEHVGAIGRVERDLGLGGRVSEAHSPVRADSAH